MKNIVIATPHARHDHLVAQLERALPQYTVVRVRSREGLSLDALKDIQPEWIFLPHWSWMIPRDIHLGYQCVIFHMTALPYGRGGSPLQNLIVRGHKSTLLTALRCVDELDAGPIYLQRELRLDGTAEQIFARTSDLMEPMIIEIIRTNPEPKPQAGEVVRFTRRKPEDGNLCTLASLEEAYDHIRMLDANGYPPAYLESQGLVFEFTGVELVGDELMARVRIRRRQDE